MLELSTSNTDARAKSLAPFPHSAVDYALVQFLPRLHNSLSQIVGIPDLRPVDFLLHDAPDPVFHRIQVRAVRGPQSRGNELWSDSLKQLNGFTSSMCGGAVLLKNEKL